ncbi:hypothetical protein DKX38_004331 [Salix brachista]|uniref:NB-ARC domain-containing protein n=1 Tax=Salix brachista TaxID=2182728 RepID=A0A5N5NB78_9ROSI|nr:hypothetical protein DKX38_004331 [Salix brachista]
MSEGIVTFLITKLGDFLLERGKELETVKNEAEYVSDELAFMKAFLRLADAMEESDSALRLLVKKVRDVAYDTEDALDEFRLCLANDNGYGIFSCFRKICRSVKDARARRRIASKIQVIKSRVISITESHRRYCNKNNIMVHGSSSDSTTRIECQRDALLLEEADLVGIEKPKKQLIERLLGTKSGREVVSVVGMGGLGKTTLVKRVYDDPDVKKHYKFRAWITVSQSYKTGDLLKHMIQQLFHVLRKPDPHGVEEMDYDKLMMIINKLLNVLDLQGAPLKEFPNEVVNLFLLKYLSLRYTKVDAIPNSIGNLQNLETLDLKHSRVTELPVGILKLQKLRNLLGGIPCLQKLIILGCRLLRRVPFGIQHLPELKVLDFVDMPDDFIKRLRPDEGGGGDYLKIRNIPEVYCTHQINGNWEAYSVGSFKKVKIVNTCEYSVVTVLVHNFVVLVVNCCKPGTDEENLCGETGNETLSLTSLTTSQQEQQKCSSDHLYFFRGQVRCNAIDLEHTEGRPLGSDDTWLCFGIHRLLAADKINMIICQVDK